MSATKPATSANADGIQSGNIEGTSVYSENGNSLQIGGRAEARISIMDGKAEDVSRVRLNFLGTTQITETLYGVGFYEGEFLTDPDNLVDNRYAYAGIGGAFGEVTYGKNDGALGVLTDFTDIMSYHGNSAAYKIAVADRVNNMFSYSGTFSDFTVKASYRIADREEMNDGQYIDNNGNGYSLSAIYNIGDTGIQLGAGYADQNEQNQYMLAASYSIHDFYFAGTFTDGKLQEDNGDYTGYEVATAYVIDQTAFTATYNKSDYNNTTASDNLAFDVTYYFKPNFRTYLSYNINLIETGDTIGDTDNLETRTATEWDAENELALGLRYDF
ncbi:porin [Vibrio mediterranei]|uniref:porin n=1 Tax=Vibrio mediterranei TaxID=689 RepID=UPI004067C71E